MFYYLDMCIFYISDHKLGTCFTILKDYQKSCCIIRVITWGHFCLSVVVDIMKITHGPFSAHQFSSVFVYLMCGPRQLSSFQCGPETPEGWTPRKTSRHLTITQFPPSRSSPRAATPQIVSSLAVRDNFQRNTWLLEQFPGMPCFFPCSLY